MILDKLLDQYPKNISKTQRQISIDLKNKSIVYGAKNIGKTSYVLNYFANIKQKKLYIDLQNPKIDASKDLSNLCEFCLNNEIKMLIIDSFENNQIFKMPNIDHVILISNKPYDIDGFTNIELPPITFNEYNKIHKQNTQESLNSYIKYGNMLDSETIREYRKIEILHTFSGNSTNFWILKNLILHLGSKISTHQIHSKIKKEGKISKDRFYEYTKFLSDSKFLFMVEKLFHKSAPKKLYFYDFTLKNIISFERNFSALFENMIFLEILYNILDGNINEIYYTDKIDFYIPRYSIGILCIPFLINDILETKLQKITKEREFCDKFIIISLSEKSQGENLGMPYEIIPFYELASLNIK